MNLDLAIGQVESRPAAYVLRSSKTDYYYKGSCRNLDERLKDHRAGRVGRTKNHRPLSLVHFEYFDSYRQARKRENYFKSGSGREWLSRHIK